MVNCWAICTFCKSIKKVFSCRECIAHTLLLLSHRYQAECSYTKCCYAVIDKDLLGNYVWETGNDMSS